MEQERQCQDEYRTQCPIANHFHPISLVSPIQISPTNNGTTKEKGKASKHFAYRINWEKIHILRNSNHWSFHILCLEATLSAGEKAEKLAAAFSLDKLLSLLSFGQKTPQHEEMVHCTCTWLLFLQEVAEYKRPDTNLVLWGWLFFCQVLSVFLFGWFFQVCGGFLLLVWFFFKWKF